ncbi:hypothetical protein HID58_068928 [Brassica napus]|uniref:Protein kinase domain-containing protein n=1 Tax=Brassica napus TaxID=3708 RepID=A0ABQ7ZMR9_BRANA|nr:hypothetical protein HID58_068928 [Brassica napus]
MGCVLSRPGSSGLVSESREEASTRIESNRKEANNVSVTTTESTSVAVVVSSTGEEVRNGEAIVEDHKEENGDVKEKKPKGERKKSTTKPDPRLSNPPKNLPGEQVAAGWPPWLTEVCGEALNGWLPRKADSFEKIEKIGSGTYSNVYKARDSLTGAIVALKKVRCETMEQENLKFMAREILILRRLNHPNVIKLEGLVTSRMSNSLYLVFRYMHHDLAGLAASPVITFTEQQVKCYMKQILSGLEHCHSRGVLHRDIKGSNLLIDDDGVLRIGDFGLATFFDASIRQKMTTRVVTLWYRAPELLHGAVEYGVGIDLWSAGCILAELLSGRPIMPGRNEVDQIHRIYKLCGSPSEEYWRKIRLPSHVKHANHTAKAQHKRKFFTTEPFACEPSELPKYPPTKEIDAKKRDEEYRRQREVRKVQGESGRRIRPRDRAPRAMPAPEANAENQSNIDRMRLITHANAKSKSEKFPPPHQDGSLGYQVGSSRRLDPSEIPFSSNSFTATYSKEPFQTWSGPLAPTEAHDSTAKRMKDINKERRKAAKLKGKRIVV